MKAAHYGPKRIKGLLDNYQSLAIVAALLLISFSSFAQYDSLKVRQIQSSYGFEWKNAKINSSFIIPNDTPRLAYKDSGAVSYKGSSLWVYNGRYWTGISGSSSTPVNDIVIYKENTEWSGYTDIPGGLFNYTTSPYAGTYSTYSPAFSVGQYIEYTAPDTYTATGYDTLRMRIKNLDAFNSSTKYNFRFYNGVDISSSAVTVNTGSYGWDRTISGAYQDVKIPANSFGFTGPFNKLFIGMSGANSTGFQLDNIILSSGGTNTAYVLDSLMWQTIYKAYTDSIAFRSALTDTAAAIRGDMLTSFTFTPNYNNKLFLLYTNGVLTDSVPSGVKDVYGLGGITITDSIGNVYISGSGSGSTDTSLIREIVSDSIYSKLSISDTAAMLSPYKTSYPRQAISLTTTGTSGAATYSNSTGVLNVPQYSGGSGTQKVYAPLVISGDSISQRFNVKAYGAAGDSTQDATPYVQLAVNAALNNGGGDIFFPVGFYTFSSPLVTSENGVNPNSQIYIPPINYNNKARAHIRFIGESAPNFLPSLLYVDSPTTRSGVMIKSKITGTGTTPSVFGGIGYGGIYGTFTYHMVTFENLNITVPANAGTTGPTMSGVNGANFASLIVKNCVIGVDTTMARDTLPLNEVAGIITPKAGGETFSEIRSTVVYGFRYGMFVGEHTILDNAQGWNCYASFAFQHCGALGSHPIYATKISSFWSAIDILIPNTTLFGVTPGPISFNIAQLNVETFNFSPRWFNNVYTVKDSLNYGIGHLNYKISNGTTGFPNQGNLTFLKYKGDSIQVNKYNAGIADISIGNTFAQGQTITNASNAFLNLKSTVNSASSNLQFSNSVSTRWVLGSNLLGSNKHDFYLYDNKNLLAKFYADSTGNMNIGGTATAAATSAISITGTNNNVGMIGTNINLGTSSTKGHLTVIDASGSTYTGYLQNTNANWQTAFYLENNRGSDASFGGLVYGGSTQGGGNFFGMTRADKLFLLSIGANNLGLGVGTYNSAPVVLGTNNTERVRITPTGITSLYSGSAVVSAGTITPTGNLFHVTGTTTITSISATGITAGTTITIIFDGALTFTDGSNLKLAGNMTTSADATITLCYDGTNWYEKARSIN